jgi:hypothetical protein
MRAIFESFRPKEDPKEPRQTLESQGILEEPNSRLNLIGAPLSVRRFEDKELGTVFVGLIDRPYAGEHLMTLLNSVSIAYPKGQNKETMRAYDMVGDHKIEEYALFENTFKHLHHKHMEDPVIGSSYREFIHSHARRWIQAGNEETANVMIDVAMSLHDKKAVEHVAMDDGWVQAVALPGHTHAIGPRGLMVRGFQVTQKENELRIQHPRESMHIIIDTKGAEIVHVVRSVIDDNAHISWPATWRMKELVFSKEYHWRAIRPLMAWSLREGKRTFVSQLDIWKLYEKANIRTDHLLERNKDVFLGRAVLAYLSPSITSTFAWHMKLRGVKQFQEMAAAQVPVWASLKQYAGKLLSDDNPVVGAIESLA